MTRHVSKVAVRVTGSSVYDAVCWPTATAFEAIPRVLHGEAVGLNPNTDLQTQITCRATLCAHAGATSRGHPMRAKAPQMRREMVSELIRMLRLAQDLEVQLIITPSSHFRPRFARGEVPAPIPGGPAAPVPEPPLGWQRQHEPALKTASPVFK
jgi:hypothetical protein